MPVRSLEKQDAAQPTACLREKVRPTAAELIATGRTRQVMKLESYGIFCSTTLIAANSTRANAAAPLRLQGSLHAATCVPCTKLTNACMKHQLTVSKRASGRLMKMADASSVCEKVKTISQTRRGASARWQISPFAELPCQVSLPSRRAHSRFGLRTRNTCGRALANCDALSWRQD